MSLPSADDLESYPHIIFILDDTWNPSFLDHKHVLGDVYYVDFIHGFQDHQTIDFGEVTFDQQARIDYYLLRAHEPFVHHHDPHYEAMRPYLGRVNLVHEKNLKKKT
jgi:hypothetical protein